jgi:hypothetical protein
MHEEACACSPKHKRRWPARLAAHAAPLHGSLVEAARADACTQTVMPSLDTWGSRPVIPCHRYTSVAERTFYPKWEERFRIPVANAPKDVEFQVKVPQHAP